MKVAVSANEPTLDSTVDPRFGRCHYFVIVDTETMQFEYLQNVSQYAAHGAGIQAAQNIAGKGVKVVLTGNVGPNAYQSLSAAGIKIVTGADGTVRETIARYKKGVLGETSSPTVSGHFGVGGGRGMGGGHGFNGEYVNIEKMQRMTENEGEKVTRVVIPVRDNEGVESQLSEHFGRAPFFAVFDFDEDGKLLSSRAVPNESEHFGGVGFPPDRILQLEPKAVITYGMGPRALGSFQDARVAVMRANSGMAKDVLSAYLKNQLQELTEGCHHALHR